MKMFTSIESDCENPNFTLGTAEQDRVVAAYGKLIGNASSDTETVQYAVNVLKQYNDNLTTYVSDYAKGQAVYEIVKELIMIYSLICKIRISNLMKQCGMERLITL